MIDLGTGPAPSRFGTVTLSADEMQALTELLEIDELPTVLNAMGRYDHQAAHDAAMEAARHVLSERGVIDEFGDVEPGVSAWLRALARPRWVIPLRLFTGETMHRFCIAQGGGAERGGTSPDRLVVASRSGDEYVLSEPDGNPAEPLAAALTDVEGLAFSGINAPTAELSPIFDDIGDAGATTTRLVKLGANATDAAIVARAMAHCHAHAEIVGVVYGDATRETADGHLAIFDTRDGRILATASTALDGTKWSALSSGTPARLRQAIGTLISSMPSPP